jgi:hypothetical protein
MLKTVISPVTLTPCGRGEQRYSDLQTASAPKDKTDIRVTAEPPGWPTSRPAFG